MKIKIQTAGPASVPGTSLHQYRLSTNFDGTDETLTIKVLIPIQESHRANHRAAVARAKELAKRFVAMDLPENE